MPRYTTQLYYGRVVVMVGSESMEQTIAFAQQVKNEIPHATVRAQWVFYKDGEETIEQEEVMK